MFIQINFSGGVNHAEEVPKEKQAELAGKIVKLVSAALETNCANGSGGISVGESTASFAVSFAVTSTYSL